MMARHVITSFYWWCLELGPNSPSVVNEMPASVPSGP